MAKKTAEPVAIPKKYRVLSDTSIGGVAYRVNDVVILAEADGALYVEIGVADADPSAVAYCEGELGAVARDNAAEAAALAPDSE